MFMFVDVADKVFKKYSSSPVAIRGVALVSVWTRALRGKKNPFRSALQIRIVLDY